MASSRIEVFEKFLVESNKNIHALYHLKKETIRSILSESTDVKYMDLCSNIDELSENYGTVEEVPQEVLSTHISWIMNYLMNSLGLSMAQIKNARRKLENNEPIEDDSKQKIERLELEEDIKSISKPKSVNEISKREDDKKSKKEILDEEKPTDINEEEQKDSENDHIEIGEDEYDGGFVNTDIDPSLYEDEFLEESPSEEYEQSNEKESDQKEGDTSETEDIYDNGNEQSIEADEHSQEEEYDDQVESMYGGESDRNENRGVISGINQSFPREYRDSIPLEDDDPEEDTVAISENISLDKEYILKEEVPSSKLLEYIVRQEKRIAILEKRINELEARMPQTGSLDIGRMYKVYPDRIEFYKNNKHFRSIPNRFVNFGQQTQVTGYRGFMQFEGDNWVLGMSNNVQLADSIPIYSFGADPVRFEKMLKEYLAIL